MNFQSAFKLKLIYVLRINDAAHSGCLKVGETTLRDSSAPLELQNNCQQLNQAARERIAQYTSTAGISYDLLHTELTLCVRDGRFCAFNDGEVHKILRRSGIRQKFFATDKRANEWFCTDLQTVRRAIVAAKEGRQSLQPGEISIGRSPIELRPEQRDAINRAKARFAKGDKFLWNAKMRFGKTLAALQLVKEMDFERTLILTHRPVVDKGWFDDFGRIFYDTLRFRYGSKNNGDSFAALEERHRRAGTHYVYFASMQDLRGSELVGGNFDKNSGLFAADWQLIIIDEAHEGTKTALGDAVLGELAKAATKSLHLSGTPYNILADFKDEEIYMWDYVKEQRAKQEWEQTHWGDPNPYACLPRLNIYTYDLSLELKKFQDNEHAFNFKEFFRVADDGRFVHEADIDRFLHLLAASSDTSRYPYSTAEWRRNFRHSLWTVPGVREARALKERLERHPILGHFRIVNVAGDGVADSDYESNNALEMVEEAIGPNPDETWTITLSCGRLTTGVSVSAWTAVFMMSGSSSTSASSYMQTIFRVQTPAQFNGRIKSECFVFDFAPDRTLRVLAEATKNVSARGATKSDDRRAVGEFLNFCPVVSFHGSQMSSVDVPHMMQQLKRVYVERVVRNGFEDGYLYNDNLFCLSPDELSEFAKLKKTIAHTKSMPKTGDVEMNRQGFTNEEYEQLQRAEAKKKEQQTEVDKALLEKKKEIRKNRDTAIAVLRAISIRMPMILYGANIADEESEITLDNFTNLVDAQSWDEFMPKGVSKQKFCAFKKYYDEDIFAAAGKRIRAMARAADQMGVEERIERITSIFATFRNPDKETVLTPWRVVNMHLGDTLGGYTFFNEDFSEPVSVPRYVEHHKITDEVFAPGSHLLEINSKSGLYPLYLAYNLYRRRLQERPAIAAASSPDAAEPVRSAQLKIWDEVLRDNIFIVCKTPMAKAITRRTLVGFRSAKVNTRYFEDLINAITNKREQFIKRITDGQGYWKANNNRNMKFNAVVGNPPYQKINEGNGSGADPVYHFFIDISILLGIRSTLIHPARFLFNAGKTSKGWNEKILNDEHFRVVKYFDTSAAVFENVDIKGGVAITMSDKTRTFKKIGLFSPHEELVTIVERVTQMTGFVSFSNIVYPRDLYKFTEELYKENEWAETRQSEGHRYDVGSGVFSVFPEIFINEKPAKIEEFSLIFGRENVARTSKWIKRKYLKVPDNFEKYKIFVPKSNGSGALGETLSSPIIGRPNVGHTVTFLSIGKFDTIFEAESALKYIKTKFTRTLLGSLKVTQDNPKDTWANIPLQDFTQQSDIDWNKNIAEIDRQLYQKYGLTQQEQDFIERMIKPMQ